MKLRFWKSDDYTTPPPYFITDESQVKPYRPWVLAISTFVATLVVLTLLFVAGRWIYHRVRDNKAVTPTQTTQTTEVTPTPSATPTVTPTPTPQPTVVPTPIVTPVKTSLPNTGMDGEE